VYRFVDAVYESLRQMAGMKEAILCCGAITSGGHKVLFHIGLGNKESYDSWLEFFRHMQGRGLRMPLLVVSDGVLGLIKAVHYGAYFYPFGKMAHSPAGIDVFSRSI